jgi:hypothetical protein
MESECGVTPAARHRQNHSTEAAFIFQKKERKLRMEEAQKTSQPCDSADVTLSRSVCKFHQRGHCKFGVNCRHFHSKNICPKLHCEDSSCRDRHPAKCVYHLRFGHCRFGSGCSYFHGSVETDDSVQSLKNNILKLKETLGNVVASLQSKETEMKALEQRIFSLECNEAKVVKFPCTDCDYEAASSTALKSHMTKKHKQETLRSKHPEEDCRGLSPVKHAPRDAEPSTTVGSKCTIAVTLMENSCHICNNFFNKESDFKFHMVS